MEQLNDFLKGTEPRVDTKTLDSLIAKYEWLMTARCVRAVLSGNVDSRLGLGAHSRAESSLAQTKIDFGAMSRLSSDDIINRFLREDDLRIVASSDGDQIEVSLDAEFDDDDDFVSEDLAEIYRSQALYEQAIAIYRKLSLLNPEKSVYFAEIIRQIETTSRENK